MTSKSTTSKPRIFSCVLWLTLIWYEFTPTYGYIKEKGLTGVEAMGVPIVLKDDLSARPSRNTSESDENLIIPDLVEAERLMSDSYVRAGVKDVVATVTKPVIQALMARVYLHHEDWQLAADYAD